MKFFFVVVPWTTTVYLKLDGIQRHKGLIVIFFYSWFGLGCQTISTVETMTIFIIIPWVIARDTKQVTVGGDIL